MSTWLPPPQSPRPDSTLPGDPNQILAQVNYYLNGPERGMFGLPWNQLPPGYQAELAKLLPPNILAAVSSGQMTTGGALLRVRARLTGQLPGQQPPTTQVTVDPGQQFVAGQPTVGGPRFMGMPSSAPPPPPGGPFQQGSPRTFEYGGGGPFAPESSGGNVGMGGPRLGAQRPRFAPPPRWGNATPFSGTPFTPPSAPLPPRNRNPRPTTGGPLTPPPPEADPFNPDPTRNTQPRVDIFWRGPRGGGFGGF